MEIIGSVSLYMRRLFLNRSTDELSSIGQIVTAALTAIVSFSIKSASSSSELVDVNLKTRKNKVYFCIVCVYESSDMKKRTKPMSLLCLLLC